MKKLLTIICLIAPLILMAQKPPKAFEERAALNSGWTSANFSMVQNFDMIYDGVRGTRYFIDAYSSGEIWMTNDRHFDQKDIQYKFDELENAVQVRFASGKEILLDAKDVIRFRLDVGTHSVFYESAIVPNSSAKEVKLFQILYHGNATTLLKMPQKKFKRVENMGAYTKNERYDEYEDQSRYFVKISEKPFAEIKKRTKRGLLSAMPSKKTKLQSLFDTVPKYANETEFKDALLVELAKEIDLKKTENQ